MTLPKSLTAVTPFSKFLALVFFVMLPFLGFFFGMAYQQQVGNLPQESVPSEYANPSPTPTPTKNNSILKSLDKIKLPVDWKFSSQKPYDYGGTNSREAIYFVSPNFAKGTDNINVYTGFEKGTVITVDSFDSQKENDFIRNYTSASTIRVKNSTQETFFEKGVSTELASGKILASYESHWEGDYRHYGILTPTGEGEIYIKVSYAENSPNELKSYEKDIKEIVNEIASK